MSLSMFDLTDRVAIVTGGGRGLGRAIALGFAEAGADVVVCARTTAQIEDTAAKIRDKGRKALAITTDVRNVDQVTNLLHETLAHFSKVDILVNNVGDTPTGTPGDLLQLTFQDWEAYVEVNLHTVFYCTRIIGEQMVKQRAGNIINMSSVVGTGPYGTYGTYTHYSAAKAGIINLTQALAVQWARYNIRINAIAPGIIETPLIIKRYKTEPGLKESLLSRIPVQRLGKPEDVVGAAIYLASDASAYVTGQTIVISGALATSTR